MRNISSQHLIILCSAVIIMAGYFIVATPVMMDDGFHYQGFAESLARGNLDFKSFYGFQGMSFFAVPIYWLTQSPISIIITSMIFSLLSIPLAYSIGKSLGSGPLGLMIFLLTPYPYMTMMRGFQEAVLLFFTLLVIYGALQEKVWTGLAWGIGGIVKPFALVLFPLFLNKNKKALLFLFFGCIVGLAYIILNYAQTGHFVTLAATGAYQGAFDPGNIPALEKSFVISWKSWARVVANFLIAPRKIMVSPLLIIIGFVALWRVKTIPLRRRIILAVLLNILLVGPITYAFPKYILPATTLLSLAAIPFLIRYPILVPLVLIDSISVFVANVAYFGKNFWDSSLVAFIPFFLAIAIWLWTSLQNRGYMRSP